ncbi:MAG: lipopolysaccharide transport periplasmic protein LptA [Gammaproteobacteria bacterium]|nr:lipopolysaccharide transport periplasmic protein LptA [Gammaproteobacteria bacterium]
MRTGFKRVRRLHFRLHLWAAVALAGVAWPAGALDSDKRQPATLEADDFEFDLEAGVRIYRGNVVFRQGSMHLDCDALVTHYAEDNELEKGVCTGRPGRFKQRPEGRTADVHGHALSITLDNLRSLVILDGEAEVEQAGDRIRGRRITYDLRSKKARVTGGAGTTAGQSGDDAGQRPHLIFQPRNEQSN